MRIEDKRVKVCGPVHNPNYKHFQSTKDEW